MKIAVFGSGGVGGYFGARLAAAGNEVHFIARGAHLQAIWTGGLRVQSALGNVELRPPVHEDPAEIGPVDVVMLTVKLWDVETAAQRLAPLVRGGGHVIPFQNGIEAASMVARAVGADSVMGGSAYVAARVKAPGVIEHTGTMARLRFGVLRKGQEAAAAQFLQACTQAKISAEVVPDIELVNWEKFAFLVAMSSATAVSRAPNGVVQSDPDLAWLFEAAMRETWRLARARNIRLPDDFVEKHLEFAKTLPAEMRASLAHDLEAGNRLEAPWLCGAVARMSADAGLEAPVNRAVYAALKPFVNGR